MSDFYIDPPGMNHLHNHLNRVEDDARTARDHVRNQTSLSWYGEGLLLDMEGSHDQARRFVTDALSAVAEIAVTAKVALNETTMYYQVTDRESAALFDADMPEAANPDEHRYAYGGSDSPFPGAAPFGDPTDPTGRLTDPEYAVASAPFQYDPTSDLLSPSTYVRWAVSEVTGVDPFVLAANMLSGQWGEYYACSVVWENVGEFARDLSENLISGAGDVHTVWRGNAAEHYRDFHMAFAATVAALHGSCGVLSEKYVEAAQVVRDLNEALTGLLGEIADNAIKFVLARCAAAVTVATIIGALGGGALSVYYAERVVELIGEVNTVYGRAKTALAAIRAEMGVVSATDLSGLTRLNVPEPFLHPVR